MSYFFDKVSIVTGGASGIGRAVCEEMGLQGAKVIVADCDLNGAELVAKSIQAKGSHAQAARIDVSNRNDVMSLVNRVVSEHGRLDYMFNNAGICIVGETYDLTEDDWRHIVDVNFFGVIHGIEAAYPVMKKQGFGHIVNTASLAGLGPCALAAAYVATKHAVVGLSLSLRMEAADNGVKVSVVCPGFVETNIPSAAVYRGVSKESLFARAPTKWLRADKAACSILAGVAKNRGVIVFPISARLIWLIARLCPQLLFFIGTGKLRDFRASVNR